MSSAARFGAPLSGRAAIPVSTLLAAPERYDGQDVKVAGQVGGVCQHKGCWMTLGTGEPGAQAVRVRFKDYGFFVPTDSMGKQAVVEGRFSIATLSAAEAQHDAEDGARFGTKVPAVTAPQRTLAMLATGVAFPSGMP